jgi:hypothetical protein
MQLLNVDVPIDVILTGMLIELILVLWKTELPIIFTFEGIVIEVRDVVWKAELPIDVTPFGIIIEDNLLQLSKTESLIDDMVDVGGIVTEVKEIQLANEACPNDVINAGILIEISGVF